MSISQINAASIQPGTVIASDIAANTITQSNLTIGAPYWNSSNQVGIGTTTPGYQLDVQGPTGIVSTKSTTGTNTSYFISNNTGGATAVGIDSSSGILTGTNYASFLWSSVNSPIIFSNNSTERMRIDTSGNVGIGTITPASAGGNLNLVVQTSGAASIIKTTTSASSSSAVARYDMSTGTGNSYSIIGLHDNSGSPYFQLTSGSAVTANYYDAATHYFRSLSGANWLTINSSGYVGIGTSSPQGSLDIGVGSSSSNPTYLGTLRLGGYGSQSLASNGGIEFMAATSSSGYGWRIGGIDLGNGNVPFVYQYRMNSTIWSEAMRITSNGNVCIGTSTAAKKLTVSGSASFGDSSVPSSSTTTELWNSALNANGSATIGCYAGTSQTIASIIAYDGNAVLNSNKSWSFTAGSNSMTYNTSGYLGIATASPTAYLDVNPNGVTYTYGAFARFGRNTSGVAQAVLGIENTGSGTSSEDFNLYASSTSYTNSSTVGWGQYRILNATGRSSVYNHATFMASGGSNTNFYFRGDGNAYAHASWNSNGVDYAEYFESTDGSIIPVGKTVVLVNGKIRASTNTDTPSSILGVVRPKINCKGPSIVGGGNTTEWQDKYLTDDYGQYIMEPYSTYEWVEEITDSEGSVTKKYHDYTTDGVPEEITVPSDVVPKTHYEDGTPLIRQKLNPAFDPEQKYVSREKRDEWHVIGLLGQVPVTKGQTTGDRWIKLNDVSDTVEMWLIK